MLRIFKRFFKKKEFTSPIEYLSLEDVMGLSTGDEVLLNVNGELIKSFVKPRWNDNKVTFSTGHMVSRNNYVPSRDYFRTQLSKSYYITKVALVNSRNSDLYLGALNKFDAAKLKPGVNYIGYLTESGVKEIRVKVSGRLVTSEEVRFYINQLSERGSIAGNGNSGKYLFITKNTEFIESVDLEELNTGVLVDVYDHNDRFQVKKMVIKYPLKDRTQVTLSLLGTADVIIITRSQVETSSYPYTIVLSDDKRMKG